MKYDKPIPSKPFKTKRGYTNFVKRYFETRGFKTRPAEYDDNGDCIFCGEAGRCAGVHGIRFDYCLGISDEF